MAKRAQQSTLRVPRSDDLFNFGLDPEKAEEYRDETVSIKQVSD
ncbi:MAG: hypothetical protein ABIO49_04100 [Dokdonella sp.]